jgi:hypothetical protein
VKPSTERIRIELTFGALTMRELADRCGVKHTHKLHPLISQMRHRTKEVVKVGTRYTLRRNRCRLSEVWS